MLSKQSQALPIELAKKTIGGGTLCYCGSSCSGAENLTSAMPCYDALYKIAKLPQPPSLASMAFQCLDHFGSIIAAIYGDSTEFCCVSLEFDRFMGRTDHTLHHSGRLSANALLFSSFN